MQWDVKNKKVILETLPFHVEQLEFHDKVRGEDTHPYHRLQCPDWVNILPVTANSEAVLVRQSRAGTLNNVLETPGGVMEANEKDTAMAALRELEEETGYTSRRIIPLGSINPNPALFSNRLHMFLAFDCFMTTDRKHHPDPGEHIEIALTPIGTLDHLVRTGQINSCLVSLTIMLSQKYLASK